MRKGIILAGGSGTRLAPVSTPSHPKPFLPLLSEKTLFEETIDTCITFQTINGCDSTIYLELTINNSETTDSEVEACEFFTLPGGDVVYQSGNYTDTLTNTEGCDSIINFDVTIHYSSFESLTIEACESYTVPSGNATYTTSGTYTDVVYDNVGCQTDYSIDLTIANLTASIGVSSDGATLSSSSVAVHYQWVRCLSNNQYEVIQGETNNTFSPSSNGEFALIIEDDMGCIDTFSSRFGLNCSR